MFMPYVLNKDYVNRLLETIGGGFVISYLNPYKWLKDESHMDFALVQENGILFYL